MIRPLVRIAACALVCLAVRAGSASAAVAHVASGQGECGGAAFAGNIASICSSVNTKTFTYTATGTGNGVLLALGCAGTAIPSAIALTATGWTTTQVGVIVGSTTAGFQALFKAYAPNTSAATFTMTWTSTGNCAGFMNDLIDEFSGMDATNFVDASASGTGSTGCALSVTPVAANDGIWFACNDSVTATGTFTKGADDTAQDVSEWKILTGGAGTPVASAWTTSGNFTIWGVAIKPAGGAAACAPSLSLLGVGRCG